LLLQTEDFNMDNPNVDSSAAPPPPVKKKAVKKKGAKRK